jgi:hypothetical protein
MINLRKRIRHWLGIAEHTHHLVQIEAMLEDIDRKLGLLTSDLSSVSGTLGRVVATVGSAPAASVIAERNDGNRPMKHEPRIEAYEPAISRLRACRMLAPRDGRTNDVRWLIAEALRRLHDRIQGERMPEVLTQVQRYKMASAQRLAGAAWPILRAIVLHDRDVHQCREMIEDETRPHCADAVILDRLRNGLDAIGPLLGVTSGVGRAA